MNITRHLIPKSYIVAAPRNSVASLSSLAGSDQDKILGTTKETAFFLTDSVETLKSLADTGVQVFPNYQYEGDLFDAPVPGSIAREAPGLPRHLDIIDIKKAWEVTRGDSSIFSAVTDSGLDLDHPQIQSSVWKNAEEVEGNGIDDDHNGKIDDVVGWDFSDDDADPAEPDGTHHTHVFGILHAQEGESGVVGVAPQARGMSLRIGGGKRRFSSSMMVESYLYALQEGVKSINTSFNIDGFVGDRAIETTYRELADNDVLLFNSAGNSGRRNPKRSVLDDVVLVASTQTDPEHVDQRSEFSNYGWGIDISAPGSDILSTLPGGRTGALSGTSMASPVAMGVDLLLQSAHPDWNRAQRWAQIAGTADSIDALNTDDEGQLGYGRLNAGRALTEELSPPTVTTKLNTFPNGQTMNVVIRFDKVLDPESANSGDAWRILNEKGEVVQSGPPKEVRLMTNQIDFNVARLPKGSYTLVGSAKHLKDPFGRPLDGNKDGVAGDDLVVKFQRIS